MPTDIGKHGQGAGSDDGATNSEAIEAVGEVNRVAGTNNHQDDKSDEGDEGKKPEMW